MEATKILELQDDSCRADVWRFFGDSIGPQQVLSANPDRITLIAAMRQGGAGGDYHSLSLGQINSVILYWDQNYLLTYGLTIVFTSVSNPGLVAMPVYYNSNHDGLFIVAEIFPLCPSDKQ